MSNKKIAKNHIPSFSEYLKEQLKDPQVKRYYNEFGKQLEIAYKILQLRKSSGFSQTELAKKIGTTQGNIARLESGRENFTVGTLQRIASALGYNFESRFIK